MSKTAIRKNIEQLKKRIEAGPRILKFRGKRVVPVDKWKLEDWTTFPDEYHIGFSLWLKPPHRLVERLPRPTNQTRRSNIRLATLQQLRHKTGPRGEEGH
jgi:hypothetical protein